MKRIIIALLLWNSLIIYAGDKMQNFYDFKAINITGKEIPMSTYKDKVVIVVNVASKCLYTPQYKGLQLLYKKYHEEGLEIIAFPSNEFNGQEPGTSKDIKEFCEINFGIAFPLFEKIEVNGKNTHPLYAFLKKKATGFLGTEGIKWNFTKFLINKNGKVVTRYASSTKPKSMESDILKLLK